MTTTTNTTATVTGNTYPAAKLLRDCGFAWDKDSKAWTGDAEAVAELRRKSTASYSRANQRLVMALTIVEA